MYIMEDISVTLPCVCMYVRLRTAVYRGKNTRVGEGEVNRTTCLQ